MNQLLEKLFEVWDSKHQVMTDSSAFVNAKYYLSKLLGAPFVVSDSGSCYYGDKNQPLRLADHKDKRGDSLVNVIVGRCPEDADFCISEDEAPAAVKVIINKAVKDYKVKLEIEKSVLV